MRKYEYKFIRKTKNLGFDFHRKIEEAEQEWNALGKQGWKFCKEGTGVMIFMREVEE